MLGIKGKVHEQMIEKFGLKPLTWGHIYSFSLRCEGADNNLKKYEVIILHLLSQELFLLQLLLYCVDYWAKQG